jgi:SSS family solute:Na+ symporter/sodium/proline symporter
MKFSKEEQWRREGMLYALKVAKEKGIEGLEEEIKFRNISQVPIAISRDKIDECILNIKLNTIDTMLILSASMSTLSSVSLASASVVAVDIYKGRINKKASDKRVNVTMKVLCLVFVAISVILAVLNEEFGFSAIAYMMGISWGTLAGCFIGPFVLGVIWKRVTKSAVWTSIVSCLVLTASLIFILGYNHPLCDGSFGSAFTNGINCSPMIGSICMIFSMIITPLVSLFTKAPSKKVIEEAFNKPISNEV